MFDSKLKKLGKNVVLGFFAAITLLLTLLCLFNNAYLSWDEHTTIVADKPFYLLLWFVIVLFFVYFVRKHYRTQDTYYFNKIFRRKELTEEIKKPKRNTLPIIANLLYFLIE